jgi:ERF superfamily
MTGISLETRSSSALMGALLAFQAEAPRLTKDEVAEVVSKRTGGKYTYKYTPLKTIMTEIQPLLTKHRLIWTTSPGENEQGKPTLRYRLILADQKNTPNQFVESIDGTMPLIFDGQGAQAYGSALTYARRYALVAVLNLVADDDDARSASRISNDRRLPKASRERMMEQVRASGKNPEIVLGAVGLERAEDATIRHAKQIKILLQEETDADS